MSIGWCAVSFFPDMSSPNDNPRKAKNTNRTHTRGSERFFLSWSVAVLERKYQYPETCNKMIENPAANTGILGKARRELHISDICVVKINMNEKRKDIPEIPM